MSVLHFLGSTTGRWTRAVVGASLIAIGLVVGGWWVLLAVPGVVFLATGAMDVCLLAPLAGKPLRGPAFRKEFTS